MPSVRLHSYQNNPRLKQPKTIRAPLSPPSPASSGTLMSVFIDSDFKIVKE